MKKLMSLLSVCLVVVCFMAAVVPVSAASPKDDIIAAIKEIVPAQYVEMYLPLAENVLQQIEVTQEQADEAIAHLKACKEKFHADSGESLSMYTAEERAFFLGEFDAACKNLGLSFELKISETPQHEQDVVCIIYNAKGVKLAEIDGDAVKKTNADVQINGGLIALTVILLAGTACALVYGKKLAATR